MGIVRIQAQMMLLAIPHFTALVPLVVDHEAPPRRRVCRRDSERRDHHRRFDGRDPGGR
jgi:hypothetical protein